jgi:hydrogenase maturation protease
MLADFDTPTSLVYGIGNVGRQDDGLGWAFVDWLQARDLCRTADVRKHYQLQLEDADLISRVDRVLFVDATKDPSVRSFGLSRPQPRMDLSFSSHAISVPAILAACQECFGRLPEVHVLAIRGYEWELSVGLTHRAQDNLDEATARLCLETGGPG